MTETLIGIFIDGRRINFMSFTNNTKYINLRAVKKLEDLGDDDIALGPHFEVKTYDWFRLKKPSSDPV